MPLRAFILALLCAFLIAPAASPAATTQAVQLAAVPSMFDTEAAAQAYCPRDVVVWLNIPTHIYHEKGMRWYGRTKHGACVCKREADAVGDHDTRNGQ